MFVKILFKYIFCRLSVALLQLINGISLDCIKDPFVVEVKKSKGNLFLFLNLYFFRCATNYIVCNMAKRRCKMHVNF